MALLDDIKAGYIIIDKEGGMTSFSCVNKVRKLSGLKAGHTGTLDPMAEGVLPVLLGSATKLSGIITDGEKEYTAGGLFGIRTDTLDTTGKILEEIPLDSFSISEEELRSSLLKFLGDIIQVPPMYSALKKDGKKLYELARQGIETEREGREIKIHTIELLSFSFPHFRIKVRCSKGTYIRTLIEDIGKDLGFPAVMENLVRTETGGFGIDEAVRLSDLTPDNISSTIKPVEELFKDYDKIVVDKKAVRLFSNGVRIQDKSIAAGFPEGKKLKVYSEEGEFIGTASKTDGAVTMDYRV